MYTKLTIIYASKRIYTKYIIIVSTIVHLLLLFFDFCMAETRVH